MLKSFRSQQAVVLEEDVVILPDYSNHQEVAGSEILTTKDFFCILIKSGAKVFIRSGGSIGNINMKIIEGTIFIPSNPDIQTPKVRKNA